MVKFKVWKTHSQVIDPKNPPQWYAHMIAGNSRILWVSEGYRSEASAHKVCKSTWNAIGKMFNGVSIGASVPYTKDSLLPKVKK